MIEGSRGWILIADTDNNFRNEIGPQVLAGTKVHVVEYACYQKLEDQIRENDKDILAYNRLKEDFLNLRNEKNRLKIEVEGLHKKIYDMKHGD